MLVPLLFRSTPPFCRGFAYSECMLMNPVRILQIRAIDKLEAKVTSTVLASKDEPRLVPSRAVMSREKAAAVECVYGECFPTWRHCPSLD